MSISSCRTAICGTLIGLIGLAPGLAAGAGAHEPVTGAPARTHATTHDKHKSSGTSRSPTARHSGKHRHAAHASKTGKHASKSGKAASKSGKHGKAAHHGKKTPDRATVR